MHTSTRWVRAAWNSAPSLHVCLSVWRRCTTHPPPPNPGRHNTPAHTDRHTHTHTTASGTARGLRGILGWILLRRKVLSLQAVGGIYIRRTSFAASRFSEVPTPAVRRRVGAPAAHTPARKVPTFHFFRSECRGRSVPPTKDAGSSGREEPKHPLRSE